MAGLGIRHALGPMSPPLGFPTETGVKLQRREMTLKPTSKWESLSERVSELKDGESIVLECEGDLTEEVRKICKCLNGIGACALVRRTVKIVGGKIVITRVGTRRTLGGF